MDLATMTAAPTTLAVGGRTFLVGPLRYLELGMIQRHLNEVSKSPLKLAEAEAEGLPPAERAELLAEARRASRGWAPPQVGQDARWVDALFGDPEGVALFLNVLFSKHQPDFGPDDLLHLLTHVGPRQMRPLFLIAMDEPPDPPAGDEPGAGADAPKAGAAPSTT